MAAITLNDRIADEIDREIEDREDINVFLTRNIHEPDVESMPFVSLAYDYLIDEDMERYF